MNRILWRVRFTIYMVYLLGWWFRPKDILFAWRTSKECYKNVIKGLEYWFSPKAEVEIEIDSWYE